MTKNKELLVKLMMLTATVIWGLSFIFMETALKTVDVMFLLAVRFTVSALLLGLFFLKKLRKLNRKYFLHGTVSGLILFGAYVFQTEGLKYTTPGNNAFLTAVYCVLVPFMFWALSKKRPDKFNIAAAVLCVAGIGFVSVTEGFDAVNKGDILTLAGGFLFSAHIVSLAFFAKDKDAVLYAAVQFAVFAVCAWACAFIFESPSFSGWETETFLIVFFLAVGCSCIGFTFQIYGQKYIEPSSASLILSLEAVFGVFFSLLFGREELTVLKALGFVLIFAAVIVSETKFRFLRRKKSKAAAAVNTEREAAAGEDKGGK